jgi:hypothetical protein
MTKSLQFFVIVFQYFLISVYSDGLSVSSSVPSTYNSSDEGHRRLSLDIFRSLHDYTVPKMKEVLLANSNYRNRLPFPHMVSDGLLPLEVLKAVADEIPDDPQLQSEGCVVGSQKCFKTKTERNKNAFDDEEHHGPATSALFGFLKSSTFIEFLEKLTGINDLIPDPHYRGSGIHQTLPGRTF